MTAKRRTKARPARKAYQEETVYEYALLALAAFIVLASALML